MSPAVIESRKEELLTGTAMNTLTSGIIPRCSTLPSSCAPSVLLHKDGIRPVPMVPVRSAFRFNAISIEGV